MTGLIIIWSTAILAFFWILVCFKDGRDNSGKLVMIGFLLINMTAQLAVISEVLYKAAIAAD